MTFALAHWKEIGIGLLVVLLFGMWRSRENALVERGKAQERYRVADSTLKAVRPQLARVDTLLVRDTVRVRVAIDRVTVLHDTVLKHLTDTMVVKSYIAQADTALHACTDLLSDCTRFRAYATTTINALEAKLLSTPPPRSCAMPMIVSVLAGAAGGYALHRP